MQDSINRYLPSTAQNAIMAYAGFDSVRRNFFLRRATVTPSDALLNMVFPDLPALIADIAGNPERDTPGMRRYISVLESLRVVVLQDAVAFIHLGRPDYINSPVLNHRLFRSAEFLDYYRQVVTVLEANNVHGEAVYQHWELVPHITDLRDSFQTFAASIMTAQNRLYNEVRGIQTHLQIVPNNQVVPQVEQPADETVAAVTTPPPPPPQGRPVNPRRPPPEIILRNSFTDVRDFVDYWFRQRDSIDQIETTYGTAWRRSPHNRKAFVRYKPMALHVKSIHQRFANWEDVIDRVQAECGNRSFPEFARFIQLRRAEQNAER